MIDYRDPVARSTVWHGFGVKVREELSREVATLRRDVEEQALIIDTKDVWWIFPFEGCEVKHFKTIVIQLTGLAPSQVKQDLRKQLVSLGQDCSVSIEAQVKDSSAEISHHLERHLEARLCFGRPKKI